MQTRIASLVPSLTELLFALGLGPWVVARTGFCIHPAAEAGAVPKVGGTKDVNVAKLRRLAPTHVLVNVDENRLETVAALREFVPHIIVTHPCGPEDNLGLLAQMAEHFGHLPPVLPRVQTLERELQQALAEVSAAAPEPPPKVLYLIWREPWMTVARDTYISRLLARVGAQTWPAVEGGPHGAGRYPVLQGDEPWLAAIEEVWLSSEPYQFTEQHLAAAQTLCPNARVRLVDGELLSWYGPRAAAGLRYAAELLTCRT
ncbi:helical backbone metal receptor [Ideonella paludis]|uniref:ABC transporter substrate-binding protein n=1 Tax=Ideonella paludis TaxID=1233411 RepID=A0ABS5DSR1_9BURK|nr:helical backbone metal receptor [Ideonella paludis]MBQ0934182.1 ABC transporter substrate-binding protein [Ideonella paludis]